MAGALFDLAFRLSSNITEFSKGLNVARSDVSTFDKATKTSIKSVQTSFKGVTDSVKGMAGDIAPQFGGIGNHITNTKTLITSLYLSMQSGSKIASAAVKDVVGNLKNMSLPEVWNSLKSNISSIGVNLNQGFSTLLKGGIKSAIQGIATAWKAFSAVFMATGIGAIITALVLGLTAVVTWLKSTAAGAEKFTELLNKAKAVILTIVDYLSKVGGIIVKVFKGEKLGDAWNEMKQTTKDVELQLQKNLELAGKLSKLQIADKEDEANVIMRIAQYETDIARARYEMKNEDNTLEQRLFYLNEAKQKEEELYQLKKAEAEEDYEILSLQKEMKGSARKPEDEIELAQAKAEIVRAEQQHWEMLRSIARETGKITSEMEKQLELKQQQNAIKSFSKEIETLKANAPESIKTPDRVDMSFDVQDKIREEESKAMQDDFAALTDTFAQNMTLTKAVFLGAEEQISSLKEHFKSLAPAISQSFAKVGTALSSGARNFKEYGKQILGTIRDILAGYIGEAIGTMILANIKFFSKMGPWGIALAAVASAASAGLVKTLFNSLVPTHEQGGLVGFSGMKLVGERGPELVQLPAGSQVNNANKTRGMLTDLASDNFIKSFRFVIEGDQLVGIYDRAIKLNKI